MKLSALRMVLLAVLGFAGGFLTAVILFQIPFPEGGLSEKLVCAVVIFAAFVALLWRYRETSKISAGMCELAAAARRMAIGDEGARTCINGPGELRDLGKAMEQLAGTLFGALRDLRAERDLLGGVLDAMQEGVLVVDGNGRLELVNSSLREMLLLRGDPRGRLPLEVIRHAELQAVLERARGHRVRASTELELAGLKPRRLLVHATGLPNQPRAVLAVLADVTQLRHLESLRRDFVANVSHELRTPVASIRSAAETLSAGALSDPAAAQRFVAMIERNAERMQRLVDDLLDLARIESRELRLQLESLSVDAVVEQALGLFKERADNKRVVLESDLLAGLSVRADSRAVEQVLVNLVDNAIKYCPEGVRITVRASIYSNNGAVRIAVCDNGPGIEEKHFSRLFERFYRIDAGRSREMGGTGLGLSIVKHLVEAMGGGVGVESAPSQGSTFWFTLPSANMQRSSQAE